MIRKATLSAWLFAIAAVGCGPGPILGPGPSLHWDLVRYDGVYFVSADGLESFERVTVVPRLCTEEATIQPVVGPAIVARDITMEYLDQNRRTTQIYDDDGGGTFFVKVEHGLTVDFENHRAVSVSVDHPNLLEEEKHFALLFRGQKIQIPIRRTALEELLGQPDEIARDAVPPLR